jgi:CDP-6-deoxy-D-xylo-4-hexulose-3-dehydrase
MLFAGNITKQPALANVHYKAPFELKNTDIAMENTIWFGVYPGMDEEQLNYTFQIVTGFINSHK